MLKTIDRSTLSDLASRAQTNPRLRANLNLHEDLADSVQRFINAIEPTSYLKPHRHAAPAAKWEMFVLLTGSALVLVLDDAGVVTERALLSAASGNLIVEILAGVWHTLVTLEPGTSLIEFKPGPYVPLGPDGFAPWAPDEGTPEACALVERFRHAQVGDALATR